MTHRRELARRPGEPLPAVIWGGQGPKTPIGRLSETWPPAFGFFVIEDAKGHGMATVISRLIVGKGNELGTSSREMWIS
jgi:hypothetical protein